MTQCVACWLAAGLFLNAAQPSDAAKKDLGSLQGEWKAEKAQLDGKDATPAALAKIRLTISGDSMLIDVGEARDEKAKIALDPAKSPAAIDIKPRKDTFLGIYKLDGDTLTICWAKEGDRPAEFESKEGSNRILFVLKRSKK